MAERTKPATRFEARLGSVLALALLLTAGCRRRDDTNYYELEKQKQQQAAASAEEQGIKAVRKQYRQGAAWAVNLSGKQVTDATFDSLKQFDNITELDLSKTNVSDAQMVQVNEIGSLLLKLDLSNTGVTDAGLAQLTNLLVLSDLNLAGTKVTPAGVAAFKKSRANDPRIRNLKVGVSPTVRLK
jgi:uncharacterized protein YjbI with pentapeptide repeats